MGKIVEPYKDTISRQMAIDALRDGALINYQAAGHHNGLVKAIDVIKGLPSAQPEPREDAVSREKAFSYFVTLWECIGAIMDRDEWEDACRTTANELPPVTPKQRWIPVTLETLPNPNSVVVVCGEKGTWDYGTYRGWHGNIHSWNWKKNTLKHVYWWMYKTDALPEPYREDDAK